MAEYIDKTDLLERLKNAMQSEYPANKLMINYAHSVVLHAPTADVVEVVRCKDCVYYEPCEGGKDFCCWYVSAVVKNDFCSYGERRTECTTKDITE